MVFSKTETELTEINVHHNFVVSVHVDYIDSSFALFIHERMVVYCVVYNNLNQKHLKIPNG